MLDTLRTEEGMQGISGDSALEWQAGLPALRFYL